MAISYVKPWPPVKPMDPIWLIEFGKSVTTMTPTQERNIQKAFSDYYEKCLRASNDLETALEEITEGKLKRE